MLWSAIEALETRNAAMRAILRVPDDNSLLDPRVQKLVEQPGFVVRIRRVHHGLGRLLREEVQRQSALPAPPCRARAGGVT